MNGAAMILLTAALLFVAGLLALAAVSLLLSALAGWAADPHTVAVLLWILASALLYLYAE